MTRKRHRHIAFVTLLLLPFCSAALAATIDVIAAPVEQADFSDRIEALGTLQANENVTITTSTTETVASISFDDGQRVAAGTLLVALTAGEEEALLEEARFNFEEAQKQLTRVKQLVKQQLASQSQLDESQRNFDTTRSQMLAIQSRLQDRMIRAPFAGVLGLRKVSVGTLVEPGDEITTLVDDHQMKLTFSVPSVYLSSLKPGLPVTAKTAAFGDEVFSGSIFSIDNRVDSVSASISVRAIIPNPSGKLKPGLLMTVELLHRARQALAIPEQALMPIGNEQFVYVVQGEGEQSSAERRAVTIGARRPGRAEVLSGLRAGEQVVTHGNFKLSPGQAIRILAVDDGQQPLQELLDSSAQRSQ